MTQTSRLEDPVVRQYAAALSCWLQEADETPLREAWSIGRRAVADEMDLLHLIDIHHQALAPLLAETRSVDEVKRRVARAQTFLLEVLAPVSMSHASYAETIQALEEKVEERTRALEQKANALEAANLELEQFAYVASHDLQEPLRMVVSYIRLLQKQLGEDLDRSGARYMAFVVEGAERAKQLIDDLLAFSRARSGERSLEVVDLGECLDEALQNLEIAIAESGAHISRGHLPPVRGDRPMLRQLLQNLIGNAIKFRDGRQPRVRVEGRRTDGVVVVSVQDNGVGIPPEFQEEVFRVFRRLHGRDEFPGTGIGLALARKIVERHGGRIWVESKPGKGSTFRFTVPST